MRRDEACILTYKRIVKLLVSPKGHVSELNTASEGQSARIVERTASKTSNRYTYSDGSVKASCSAFLWHINTTSVCFALP